jgi:Fe-S cluster assembly protein SufD
MNLDFKHVNALPVRTWSWLDINDNTIKETISSITAYEKNYIKSGMDFISQNTIQNKIEINELQNKIKTGMGVETAHFIRENKNSGISIRIPIGIKVKEPIVLHYDIDESNPTVIDLNHILAEEDSEVTIIMSYQSIDNYAAFHGGLTYINAKKNATINLIQIQMINQETIHFNDIGILAEDEGKVNLIQAELGASKVINGCMTDLIGNQSELAIDTIYFGNKKRSLDFNYVINHIGKYTKSELNINGALMDESSKKLRGTIDFKKGAIGAVGHEAEYNLLFSPKIKNITAPLILCGEDNVEGKHATNSGKIDENKLFYMMSRGIDEISAKKLMIDAWFQPIIDKIPAENLQEKIANYMKERLNYA